MFDTLLFFHVLAAFMLGSTVVVSSALVFGAPAAPRTSTVANVLWDVGGLGTLVFGVWLALYVDGYELWDGWIIAALVLWVLTMGSGAQVSRGVEPAGDDSSVAIDRRVMFAHWMRIVYVVALLVVMVWKPGA